MKYPLNRLTYNNKNFIYFKKDIKAKRTLLFIHGLGSSTDSLYKIFDLNLNFNIIALNLPGSKHSINQYSRPLSIELFIEHTRTFIDQFIKRKIVLVGHSLGGGVVSALSDHPKVEKVVYINTIHPFIHKSRLYQFIYKYYSKKTAWQQIKNAVINGAMTVYKNKIAKEEEKEIIETMLDQNKPEHNIVQQNLFNENFVQHTLKINYFKSLVKDPVFIIGSSDIVIEPMHFIEFVKNELKRDFILLENVVHSPFLFNCEVMVDLLQNLFPFIKRWFWQSKIMYDKNAELYKIAQVDY